MSLLARIQLVILLVLSLLLTPGAWSAVPVDTAKQACPMVNCGERCCDQMACCVHSSQDQQERQKNPATAQSIGIDPASLSPRLLTVLYLRPVVAPYPPLREDLRRAHTVSRQAATCIRLI